MKIARLPLTRAVCLALAFASLAPSVHAQQMPQDNWRYDGLQFAGPVPTAKLKCITVGVGGVYVGEKFDGAWRILQFTEGGQFVRRFATPVASIAGLACGSNGDVYALDSGDSTVKIFAQDGAFLRQFGSAGAGQEQMNPGVGNSKLAVDKNGAVYVADSGNARVQVYASNGNFLRQIGELGSLPS